MKNSFFFSFFSLGYLKLHDGGFYRGNFHEGHIEGKGTFTYGNGDLYHGWFSGGKKAGKGTFTWSNGNIYKGMLIFNFF